MRTEGGTQTGWAGALGGGVEYRGPLAARCSTEDLREGIDRERIGLLRLERSRSGHEKRR